MGEEFNIILKNNGVVEMITFSSREEYEKSTFTPDMFLSKEEIVEDLLTRLEQENLTYLTTCPEDDLIMLHHGFGTWIRNIYGMWLPENPYTKGEDAMADEFPDQYSFTVITMLHNHLNNKQQAINAFDRAKKVIN